MSILMEGKLNKVQSLWFGVAPSLTMRTVQGTIENCGALTDLGNLSTWDIDPDDLMLIYAQVMSMNIDLKIHAYYGPDEEIDFD